jgi:hypothetical protein
MPKWIIHPKKTRSAQQKAHTNTLVGHRTELPTPSDQGDPSSNLSAIVESLSTSLDIEQKPSEYLKKDIKNAIQREKRAKTKVGCIALIGRSCITDYIHTQLEVLQEQVKKDLELSAQAALALQHPATVLVMDFGTSAAVQGAVAGQALWISQLCARLLSHFVAQVGPDISVNIQAY